MIPLTRREITGTRTVAYFKTPQGALFRMVLTDHEYKNLRGDDGRGPYLTQTGRDIRPTPDAVCYKALDEIELNTNSGFASAGDYYEHKGFVHVSIDGRHAIRFDPHEYDGDPRQPATLEAITTDQHGNAIQLNNGFLKIWPSHTTQPAKIAAPA